MRSVLVVLGWSVAASVALGGCGVFKSSTSQASSESSSKSISSPIRSLSKSSKSSSPEASYRGDVAEATRSWTLTGGETAALQHDISRIAAEAGISDWEGRQSTWEGVGRGLKRAGVSGARFEQLKGKLAGGSPERAQWIDAGYRSG